MSESDAIAKVEERYQRTAAALERSNRKLVELRVEAILKEDVEFSALKEEDKKLRAIVHRARLNLSKKGVKFQRLLRELESVYVGLVENHAHETSASIGIEENQRCQAIKYERAMHRVRAELGMSPLGY